MGQCLHCGETTRWPRRLHRGCRGAWVQRLIRSYPRPTLPPELARTDCLACGDRLQQETTFACRGVPHDRPGHELVYHHEVLSRCPGCGRGQLEKSDHDCYDFFESWDWYEWFLIDHPDMESLHEVVIRSRLDPGEASVAQLAASASALALRSWSGGAVLPRFADRSTVNKHVTPIRIRWDGDQPLFESEEKVP